MLVLAFALFALLILAWLVAPNGAPRAAARSVEPQLAPQLATSEAVA